jgi:hypothetical protein
VLAVSQERIHNTASAIYTRTSTRRVVRRQVRALKHFGRHLKLHQYGFLKLSAIECQRCFAARADGVGASFVDAHASVCFCAA